MKRNVTLYLSIHNETAAAAAIHNFAFAAQRQHSFGA